MSEPKGVQEMKPISWGRSLLFFGVPGLIMFACFRGLMPLLDLMGFHLFYVYLVGYGLLPAVLLLAALGAYQKEGHSLRDGGFRDRFRLHPMKGMDWLWTGILAVFLYATRETLEFTSAWMDSIFGSPPIFWFRMMDRDPNYFMELPFPGNYWILGGMVVLIPLMTLGYEFWFRGYILPRQELKFGKWAFLVNGVFWLWFQFYFPWDCIRILPGAILLPFAVQRLGNTQVGIIASLAIYIPDLVYVVRGIWGA